MASIVLMALLGGATRSRVFAQSQTYTVKVNADGTFSPQVLYIRSGDTVRWEQLARTDSIIPAEARPYPAICSTRKGFNESDPNNFTGPLPFAPSGVFVLGPLNAGFTEATGSCPSGSEPVARGDGGRLLCTVGPKGRTLESTWRSDQITGAYIRLYWNDVNPRPGVYDFTILQREVERVVQNGKLYSLSVQAGDFGTPDWIFSTNADGSRRPNGGGEVPRLAFQDTDDDNAANCGNRMELGNPTRDTYQQHYFSMLTEVAKFLKSRADWYRALAYIKISGANLVSAENRLPNGCRIIADVRCPCNPAAWAQDGYSPAGLYRFYDAQARLLQDLFPGKAMNYQLIQDGFPRVNDRGAYMTYGGASSDGSPLPLSFEQTQTALDRGRERWGLSFTVAHDGVQPKVPGCNFDGVHPKPERPLDGYWDVGSGCPNRWAVREGARGQITGYQTLNPLPGRVDSPRMLDLAIQNTWDNTDGVYLEIYESKFWETVNNNEGILPVSRKTINDWAEDFHRRRIDPRFPNFVAAKDPFPTTYSYTFRNPSMATQFLRYVHGMKCGAGKQEWGMIVVDANLYTVPSRGGKVLATDGTSSTVTAGYGRIRPDAGQTAPAGVAIFSYRLGQTLISETSVPATAPLKSGRIYAEVNGPLNTGIAVVNPNDRSANITFHFTDTTGTDLGPGTLTIPPNQQIAQFLDQTPLKTFTGVTFQGTFSFTSDLPVGVIAIRGLLNGRQEFLMSTLPVLDTTAPANTDAAVIPHFSDGGGWTTEILLVNPTNNTLTGTAEFRDTNGNTTRVTVGGQSNSIFSYSVPPRSSQKLTTAGATLTTTSGSVRILPTAGASAPAPQVVFSFKPAAITVSEAGVTASTGKAFRMYAESSGTDGAAGAIQSGIAMANATSVPASLTLELTNLDGSTTGLPSPSLRTLPAFGQASGFLAEFFPSLPKSFKGILRVSTTSTGVAVVGLRSRKNERDDFLITTTPPVNEQSTVGSAELLFPHFVDGGGYATQFILFSRTDGQFFSGSLILVQQAGQAFEQALR